MKAMFRTTIFLAIAAVTAGIVFSCSEDDLPNGGKPMISYVRVTDPASSDSLVVSAGQGQMIAIVGENLADAREMWINDQQAVLSPTFITNTTIITRVPSKIPSEITNKMTIYFGSGDPLVYDFAVDISAPAISYMMSEYVNTGEVATIVGDFFYEPVTVTFTGGVEGQILELEDKTIQVVVPDGAEPGPLTITTNFGSTESSFWFRDDRNIIASFDGTTNGLWWGPTYIKSADDDIENINGKFIRMKNNLGAWGWFELYVGPPESDVALELKNIPEGAFTNPDDYVLKFEMNTLKPLTGAYIHMYFGPTIEPGRHSAKYIWQPNVDTKGMWETISIPWADVLAANTELTYNPSGYGTSIHFSGPNPVTGDFAMDNMRVVPR